MVSYWPFLQIYILHIHKLCEPNTISAKKELNPVFDHLTSVDSENSRFTVTFSYFYSIFDGFGKMYVKSSAFRNALFHDRIHEVFSGSMIQNSWWYSLIQIHIYINAVSLTGAYPQLVI